MRTARSLIRLGGCPGQSESSLGAQPLCWFCHVVAHFQVQPGSQNKQVMDDLNRLTAQTIAAEEAIAYRDDQIKKLKEENVKMKDEIDNTVPILRAQVMSFSYSHLSLVMRKPVFGFLTR